MDYYIFAWDMKNSTGAIQADELTTLRYLALIANFCLESTSELPQVEVTPTGDGQRVIFPPGTDYSAAIKPFAESVVRYSQSLKQHYPDYAISCVLGEGTLQDSPLGKNGQILWELNSRLGSVPAGALELI